VFTKWLTTKGLKGTKEMNSLIDQMDGMTWEEIAKKRDRWVISKKHHGGKKQANYYT